MSIDVVADAVRSARITFAPGHANDRHIVLAQAGDEASRRHAPPHVTIGDGVINLLAALSQSETVEVLSLYRRGQGAHGVQQGRAYAVNAVDISEFAGVRINLSAGRLARFRRHPSEWATYKTDLIDAVASMIRLFPAGEYRLGFVRPVGGANTDTAMDVFYPVSDLSLLRHTTSVRRMHEPARTAIRDAQAAVRTSGVTFPHNFPDGHDHIHIQATAAPVATVPRHLAAVTA